MSLLGSASEPSGSTDRRPFSRRVELRLLGGFEFRQGEALRTIPIGSQRVVVFLAVHGRELRRTFVAGSLWPDTTDRRAGGNLRSALWRLREVRSLVVENSRSGLRLGEGTIVDVAQLLESGAPAGDRDVPRLTALARLLQAELLPDWYDEWLAEWRDRWDQFRVHSLEAMSRSLTHAGEFRLAMDTALAATRAEPFRESAHRAVIEAHLAEGNIAEALYHFQAFRASIRRELGIDASPALRELMKARASFGDTRVTQP